MLYRLILLTLIGIPLQGQVILTLSEAIGIAEKNHPHLQQLRNQYEASASQKWQQLGIDNPEAYYFAEGIPDNSADDFSEKRYGIKQNIRFPLTSFFKFREHSFKQAMLVEKIKDKCRQIRADVKQRFTTVLYRQRLEDLREQQLAVARQLLQAAETRVEVGESPDMDVMLAEIQVALAENKLESARQTNHTSRYELFNLIGLHPEEQSYNLSFADTLTFKRIDINQSVVLSVLEQTPAFRATSFALDAKKQSHNAAYSGLLPDFYLSWYRQNITGEFDLQGYEFGLKVPVFFFLNNRAEISEAAMQKNNARWAQKAERLELKKNIELAWHGYQQSKIKLERIIQTIRPRTSKYLNLSLEGYRTGDISLINYLAAQQTFLDAEENYLENLHQYYHQIIELEKYLNEELLFGQLQPGCGE
jgi:cobalt-zinc-cadmium efflux system outer membrane protein